jgi:hypothetical protein
MNTSVKLYRSMNLAEVSSPVPQSEPAWTAFSSRHNINSACTCAKLSGQMAMKNAAKNTTTASSITLE